MGWMKLILEGIINEIGAEDAYNRFYNNMSKETYDKIIGGAVNVDKFLQFLLNAVRDGDAKTEEVISLRDRVAEADNDVRQQFLEAFKRGEYKTFIDADEGFELIKGAGGITMNKLAKAGMLKLATIGIWKITATVTYAASLKFMGAGGLKSRWCTASDRRGNYDGWKQFTYYCNNGILIQAECEDIDELKRRLQEGFRPYYKAIQFQVYSDGRLGTVCDYDDNNLEYTDIKYILNEDYGKIMNYILDTDLWNQIRAIYKKYSVSENKYQGIRDIFEEKRIEAIRNKMEAVYNRYDAEARNIASEENGKAKKRWENFLNSGLDFYNPLVIKQLWEMNNADLDAMMDDDSSDDYGIVNVADYPLYSKYGCCMPTLEHFGKTYCVVVSMNPEAYETNVTYKSEDEDGNEYIQEDHPDEDYGYFINSSVRVDATSNSYQSFFIMMDCGPDDLDKNSKILYVSDVVNGFSQIKSFRQSDGSTSTFGAMTNGGKITLIDGDKGEIIKTNLTASFNLYFKNLSNFGNYFYIKAYKDDGMASNVFYALLDKSGKIINSAEYHRDWKQESATVHSRLDRGYIVFKEGEKIHVYFSNDNNEAVYLKNSITRTEFPLYHTYGPINMDFMMPSYNMKTINPIEFGVVNGKVYVFYLDASIYKGANCALLESPQSLIFGNGGIQTYLSIDAKGTQYIYNALNNILIRYYNGKYECTKIYGKEEWKPCDKDGNEIQDKVAQKNFKEWQLQGGHSPKAKAQMDKMWADKENGYGHNAFTDWKDEDRKLDDMWVKIDPNEDIPWYMPQNLKDNPNWRGAMRYISNIDGPNGGKWIGVDKYGRDIPDWSEEDERNVPANLSDRVVRESTSDIKKKLNRFL